MLQEYQARSGIHTGHPTQSLYVVLHWIDGFTEGCRILQHCWISVELFQGGADWAEQTRSPKQVNRVRAERRTRKQTSERASKEATKQMSEQTQSINASTNATLVKINGFLFMNTRTSENRVSVSRCLISLC
jgi:hypothetical protein